MADSNSEVVKVSKLARLLKQRNGAKVPEGKERKTLLEGFAATHNAKEKLKKQLAESLIAHEKQCEKLILAFGDAKIRLPDGRIFLPSSKGESAMYREQGKIDEDSLIT